MDLILKDIYEHASVTQVQSKIAASDSVQKSLTTEDEKHFDILHHSIIAKNTEVVGSLLMRGYFSSRHQPSTYPYMSLACFIGSKSAIPILMEFRGHELKTRISLQTFNQLAASLEQCDMDEPYNKERFEGGGLLPVEIAAARGHTKCVECILFTCAAYKPDCKRISLLEQAVDIDSDIVITHLLGNSPPDPSEVDNALKRAVLGKKPRVLKVLLERKPQIDHILKGMNAFHVLFTYSMDRDTLLQTTSGLVECTKLLISYGVDANTRFPLGTYPLYSLLAAVGKYDSPGISLYHYIESLNCLLAAGCIIDFDEEVELEKIELESQESKDLFDNQRLIKVYGRETFSSPWYALFVQFENTNLDVMHSLYIRQASGLLIQHGACMTHAGCDGNAPLHILMLNLSTNIGGKSTAVDMEAIMLLMLYAGADPNMKNRNGLSPIVLYFTVLFSTMHWSNQFEYTEDAMIGSNCMVPVLRLLFFMDHSNKLEAAHQITDSIDVLDAKSSNFDNATFQDIIDTIKSNCSAEVQEVDTLGKIAMLEIWKFLGRSKDRVSHSGLPVTLQKRIHGLFAP